MEARRIAAARSTVRAAARAWRGHLTRLMRGMSAQEPKTVHGPRTVASPEIQDLTPGGRTLAVPAFDGYPYLVTLVMSDLYHLSILPGDVPVDRLRDIARRQTAANRLQACLVVGPRRAIYVRLDGSEEDSPIVTRGADPVTGRLRLCEEFPDTPESRARLASLRAFVWRHSPKSGFLLGDVTKGGRPATLEERVRLEGRQASGVPRGLERCDACHRWTGLCLDPNPRWAGLVMRVDCACANDNRCAACGDPLAEDRLNSNTYDERDGEIWHMPSFAALGHRCRSGNSAGS